MREREGYTVVKSEEDDVRNFKEIFKLEVFIIKKLLIYS